MKVESEEGGRFAEASSELDAIVSQTEAATETILLNAERAQELAWTFREAGSDGALCDSLENAITEIYTGCSFQDLTGQRTRKVVTVLRYLESRINSMTGIWGLDETEKAEADRENALKSKSDGSNAVGLDALAKAVDSTPEFQRADTQFDPFDTRPDAHLLNGPQLDGRGVDQSEIDDLMNFNSADDFVAVHAEYTGTGHAIPVEPEPAEADEAMAAQLAAADVFASEPDVFAEPATLADTPPARKPRAISSGNTALAIESDPDVEAAETVPALKVIKAHDPIAELSTEERLILFG
jgi:chemotaxis regulatin CheY-phosphate phosphatase CheZ